MAPARRGGAGVANDSASVAAETSGEHGVRCPVECAAGGTAKRAAPDGCLAALRVGGTRRGQGAKYDLRMRELEAGRDQAIEVLARGLAVEPDARRPDAFSEGDQVVGAWRADRLVE